MLIIRSSDIHEAGCYTTRPIRAGARIIRYTGPEMSAREGARRYHQRAHTFLFGKRDGKTVIDGYGTAAFINHSCDPNCETHEIGGRVWIVAARDIAAGEELTYDYNLYDGEAEAPCFCGAAHCRGTLYEPGQEPGAARKVRSRGKAKRPPRRRREAPPRAA